MGYSKELNIYRSGNSATFFSYSSNGKYFEELFTFILNGIVVSGWHVTYVSVVQHARLTDWLRLKQRSKTIINGEN